MCSVVRADAHVAIGDEPVPEPDSVAVGEGVVGFVHVGGRPETLDEIRLGQRFRAVGDQQREQIERFRAEVNRPAALAEQTGVGIEHELTETEGHRSKVPDGDPHHTGGRASDELLGVDYDDRCG